MLLRTVSTATGGSLTDALADALAGGAPIAPLPTDPDEARRALAMLQPDVAVDEPDPAVIVATSGSTGPPKGVILSREAVRASATATHDRLGGPGDWLLALPTHYVAGLMVLARAVVAGTAVHPVGSDLLGLAAAPRRPAERRYLSIVPTQLVRALTQADLTAQLAELDAVLLGGAPAAPALLERAARAGIPVVTTYGMSETCGGCVYDGVPLDGVGVDLSDGRIALSGASVFSGYRLRPELTAETLVRTPDGRRQFRTQDRGAWSAGPGSNHGGPRLRVLGRFDDVVISGGLNVDLAEVERAARAIPELDGAELAVIAVPDAEWGARILAVTDHAGLDPEALRAHLRPLLPEHALPRSLVTLGTLPRTSSGKIDRQRLIADLVAPGGPNRR